MPVNAHEPAPVVVVTGDVTMDWNIACAQLAMNTASWSKEQGHTRTYWQRGGAALLADLIEAIASRLAQQHGAAFDIRQMAAPKGAVIPDYRRFHHAYKRWNHFPAQRKGGRHQTGLAYGRVVRSSTSAAEGDGAGMGVGRSTIRLTPG